MSLYKKTFGIELNKLSNGHIFLHSRCDKEDDLATISAQQYYVEYGPDIDTERLGALLPNFIPDFCMNGGSDVLERWRSLVLLAFKRNYYLKEKHNALKVKEDVVNYAKYKWPLLFSRFYEAYRYVLVC